MIFDILLLSIKLCDNFICMLNSFWDDLEIKSNIAETKYALTKINETVGNPKE